MNYDHIPSYFRSDKTKQKTADFNDNTTEDILRGMKFNRQVSTSLLFPSSEHEIPDELSMKSEPSCTMLTFPISINI